MASKTVLISGLGVGGPALAFWLKRFGFDPTVVEIARAPRTGGYMLDFWGVGYEVARRMGVLPELEKSGYTIDDVRMVNAQGRRIAGIRGDLFRRAVSNGFLSIQRGALALALWRLVEGQVPVIFGDEIASLGEAPGGVAVTFRHAEPRQFDLVVGADGLHSNVRRLSFGPQDQFEKRLGYWVGSFTTRDYPHRNEGAYTSFTRPGRQIARYALRDGRSAFLLVWSDIGATPPPRQDEAAQRAFIRNAFDGMGWEWPEIAPRLSEADDLYFDRVSQISAPQWSSGRIVLLGDAAWCPSLLAGEGSAFAVAGAYILAGELARADGDHVAAFQRYESRLRSFIERKQAAAVGFASQFAPETGFALWLRNTMTHMLRLPVVGDMMARSLFSHDFDLPDYGSGDVGQNPRSPAGQH